MIAIRPFRNHFEPQIDLGGNIDFDQQGQTSSGQTGPASVPVSLLAALLYVAQAQIVQYRFHEVVLVGIEVAFGLLL